MKYAFVLMSFFSLMCSCSTITSKGLKSSWRPLQEAESVECYDFPIGKNDIRIEKISVFEDLGPSFFVETLDRKGESALYHGVFSKLEKFSSDDLKKLTVRSGSQFLGAIVAGDKAFFVTSFFEGGVNAIEVFDLLSGEKISQEEVKSAGPLEMLDWNSKWGSLRIIAREEVLEESIEDQSAVLITVRPGLSSNFLEFDRTHKIKGEAKVFFGVNKDPYLLWIDRGTSESVDPKPKFKISSWADAKRDVVGFVADAGDVERWDLLDTEKNMVLISVSGDTLLWKNARIEHGFYYASTEIKQKSLPPKMLDRVHIGKPIIFDDGKNIIVGFQQWLDHESTFAAFKIDESGLQDIGRFGVLNAKETIDIGFYHKVSERSYFVKRANSQHVQKHSICRLNL